MADTSPPDSAPRQEAFSCLRNAFAAASDPVLLAHRGEVVFANTSATAALGRAPNELVGTRLLDLLGLPPDAHRPPTGNGTDIPALPADGTPILVERLIARPDNTTFLAEVRLARLATVEGTVDHCQIRDLSRLRQMERDLDSSKLQRRRISRVLRTIAHVNRAVLRSTSPEELLADMCRILCHDRGYDLVWIGLVNPAGTLDMVARHAATADNDGCFVAFDLPPPCARIALERGEAVLITDDDSDTCATCSAPLLSSSHSTLALPLLENERPAGILLAHSRRPDVLDDAERELLADLSLSLGYAIDNLKTTRRERRRSEELRLLNDVTRTALESHGDTEYLASALAATLEEIPQVTDCAIAIWDDTRHRIVNHAAAPGMARQGFPRVSDHAVSRLLRFQHPVSCGADLMPHSRLSPNGERPEAPVIGIPLVAREARLGAAYLVMGPDYRCHEEDLERTQQIAEHMALAIARTRASQANQRRLAALLALHETGLDLSGRRELQSLLDAIVDRAGTLLGTSMGGLYLMDRSRLLLTVARGKLEPFIGRSIAVGEGAAGQAVEERRAVIVEDYSTWPDRAALYAGTDIRSVVAVPIEWRDEILGALHVEHPEPAQFAGEEAELVTLFAEQAAVAIANARLIDGLKDAAEELTASYDATLEGWVRALDLRDQETEGHTQRVTELTLRLACAMGLNGDELRDVRRGALLHDIGKIGIPDRILRKPGPLTTEEHAIMRRHPEFARDMLEPIAHLRPALAIPYSHHERWDGSGYPEGLAGDEIPLAARIFTVVDVYDAMHSNRPYRQGLPRNRIVAYLRENAGSKFDPMVVEAFLEVLDV
jgi:response regulator RpfG family c-di-GMP phosphodiesterase